MERNDFFEAIKKNWKKIVIFGVASYMVIAFIITAVGAALISKEGKKIKNCEDRIGREFQARKADFLDRYYDNWDKGLKKLEEGFARTEKISNRDRIKRVKRGIEWQERDIEELRENNKNPEALARLEKQQECDRKNLALFQEAFDGKWASQKEGESNEAYERRKDEAEVDWWVISLKDTLEHVEIYPEKSERFIESIERGQDNLKEAKNIFFKKYGEEYPPE